MDRIKRRDEVDGIVRALHGQDHSVKGIVSTTVASRQTVRGIPVGIRGDVFRSRAITRDRRAKRLSIACWGAPPGTAEPAGDASKAIYKVRSLTNLGSFT